MLLESSAPLLGALSSSCEGLNCPSGPKVILADELTDRRKTGLRELENVKMLQLKDLVCLVLLEVCQCKKKVRCLMENYYFEASVNTFQATIWNICSTD